jgi:hypothetical protein
VRSRKVTGRKTNAIDVDIDIGIDVEGLGLGLGKNIRRI